MDLDDSFAEKLLQRRKARKGFIEEKITEVTSVGKKRAALIDEQQINTDVPPEESPKRQCTQAPQAAYSPDDKENFHMKNEELRTAFVPLQTASKTRGLAALKKNFVNGEKEDFKLKEEQNTPTSGQYFAKSPIKTLENNQMDSEGLKENYPADDECSDDDECIDEKDFAENYDEISSEHENDARMEMDYSPIKPFKTQGDMNRHLKPSIEKTSVPVQECTNTSNVDPAELPLSARKALFEKALLGGTPKLNQDVVDQKLSVAQRAAMFENATKGNSGFKQTSCFKEPKRINASHFSMFDSAGSSEIKSPVKNVQNAPLKSPVKTVQAFSANSPVKIVQNASINSPVKTVQAFSTKSPVKTIQNASLKSPVKTVQALSAKSPAKVIPDFSSCSPVKSLYPTPKTNPQDVRASPAKKVISPINSTPSPTKNVGSHTRFIQQKLIENSGSKLQGKEIAARIAEERKQEISNLVNHWEKMSSSSSVENNSEMENNYLASQEQILCESDAVTEPSENDESNSDDQNVNEFVEDDEDEQRVESEYYEEESDMDGCVFDLQNTETESLKSLESNYSNEPNMWSKEDAGSLSSQHARSVISSQSYSGISSYSDDSNYNASKSQSCTSDSSARSYDVANSNSIEGSPSSSRESKNADVPLLYTVSFYRKQKQDTRLTPVRTIVRREKVLSPESPDTDYTQVIQERIKSLQEEILRQQTVISQTSQALNLCSATAEFSGSTEQVEGERLLLIATQKRQACLNEIQRLKTCGAQGENVADGKGTLTISDIQLPLKREFMASQLEGKGTDTVHYFLCLIRHGAQVIVTQMMSTSDKVSDGALCFTNHIKLQNLPADFAIVFEVYALQTKKDILPHEKKYHIKREHSKIRLTPKGKKSDSKILMPAISSPGGPNAVRSPSFGVVGFTRFTLQNCSKKTFTLDKVPFTSPLDGVLRVKLQLHADHKVMEKGFLTMFEDVSGFGAWHRRWSALDAHHLAYWKYPDDEHKKEPIGVIDLKQCVTAEVKLVSRDVCARPHTFQLVTVRPQAKGDKNSLVSRSYNTLTTTKYLLSADTKEERILWCNKINEALINVRKWDPQALRPVEAMQN